MNIKGAFMGLSGGMLALLLVLGIGGGYIYLYGVPDLGLGEAPLAITSPARQLITDCPATTTPEMKLVVLDRINKGTLRTNNFDVNVLLNGVQNGSYHLASDSTADASPGDGYALYATQSGGSTTYFGDIITGNVKCQELEAINFYSATVGTLTLTAYNDDDGLANQISDQQVIGTGETVNIDFTLKETTADACLGTYRSTKDLMLCADYNATAMKRPVIKMSGASLPIAAVPAGHSSLQDAGGDLDTTVCVIITGVKEICDYDKLEGLSIQLEAQAGENPGEENTADVNMHLYLPQVYQDGETGDWDFYYADEYNATQIITPKTGHIFVS